MLQRTPWAPLPALRLLTLGGEVVTAALAARWCAPGRRQASVSRVVLAALRAAV
jgi:hypothetical protein